jgi:hypothetical protein
LSFGTNFLAGSSSSDKLEIENAFIQFIATYGKNYAGKGEVATRFENFAKTYKMVKAHNLKEDATSKMEINWFADLSEDEFPVMRTNTDQNQIKI